MHRASWRRGRRNYGKNTDAHLLRTLLCGLYPSAAQRGDRAGILLVQSQYPSLSGIQGPPGHADGVCPHHRYGVDRAGELRPAGFLPRSGRGYRPTLRPLLYGASGANGFASFTSTLFVSPYQQHERMAEIAEEMARRYGVRFLYRDFRPGFRAGQQEARELGFYMQKYCGCVFSEEERYQKQIQRDQKEPLKHIG